MADDEEIKSLVELLTRDGMLVPDFDVVGGSDTLGEERHVVFTHPDKLRAGIVGAGGMMPWYYGKMAASEVTELAAIFGSRGKVVDMAQHFRVPHGFFRYSGISDILAQGKPELESERQASLQLYREFLGTHDLSVVATPNNTHAPYSEAAFLVSPETRGVYCEKPSAHNIADSARLVQLEKQHPGRVAVVAHNRCLDMVLEMRYMLGQKGIGLDLPGLTAILEGQAEGTQAMPVASAILPFGEIDHGEWGYEQDYQFGLGMGWRNVKDIIAGVELGKQLDILIHGLDTLAFVTGQDIAKVISAYEHNTLTHMQPGLGEAFKEGDDTELVSVGQGTPYFNDDVLTTTVQLAGGGVFTGKVSQTAGGRKNHMYLKIFFKSGYAIEFDSDNANDMRIWGPGQDYALSRTRYADKLAYREELAPWLTNAMGMTGAPFKEDRPFKHDIGWLTTHRRQFRTFAHYLELANAGALTSTNRADIYMVPTPVQMHKRMCEAVAIYKAARDCTAVTVNHQLGL